MLSKTSKSRIIEAFYGLDYLYFGKPVQEVDYCCPIMVEDYLSTKGVLLSTLIEIFRLIEPKKNALIESKDISGSDILKLAKAASKIARENAMVIIKDKRAVKDIRESLEESLKSASSKEKEVDKIVESVIRQKAFSLATDSYLLARNLVESKQGSKLNEWTGKITGEAYKILRDKLVETAEAILSTDESV